MDEGGVAAPATEFQRPGNGMKNKGLAESGNPQAAFGGDNLYFNPRKLHPKAGREPKPVIIFTVKISRMTRQTRPIPYLLEPTRRG